MSFEAILTISEAEESAKRRIAAAQAAAKTAQADAVAEGESAMLAAAQRAADELLQLRTKSDEKAKADVEQLASGTENKKAAMRAHSEARMERAADLIVERIVNG